MCLAVQVLLLSAPALFPAGLPWVSNTLTPAEPWFFCVCLELGRILWQGMVKLRGHLGSLQCFHIHHPWPWVVVMQGPRIH